MKHHGTKAHAEVKRWIVRWSPKHERAYFSKFGEEPTWDAPTVRLQTIAQEVEATPELQMEKMQRGADISFDECTQSVLPWRPAQEEQQLAFKRLFEGIGGLQVLMLAWGEHSQDPLFHMATRTQLRRVLIWQVPG